MISVGEKKQARAANSQAKTSTFTRGLSTVKHRWPEACGSRRAPIGGRSPRVSRNVRLSAATTGPEGDREPRLIFVRRLRHCSHTGETPHRDNIFVSFVGGGWNCIRAGQEVRGPAELASPPGSGTPTWTPPRRCRRWTGWWRDDPGKTERIGMRKTGVRSCGSRWGDRWEILHVATKLSPPSHKTRPSIATHSLASGVV